MHRFTFFLAASLIGLLSIANAQQDSTSLDLRGLAAFRLGDDDVWRSKYIDEEQDWNFIPVPGAWEQFGFPLADGFAWYRVRFRLPKSMRDDSLLLVMSGVDDADETFLNGVLVGKTGAFPPLERSELRSLRVYPLPRFIREDFNLLAVRVYDQGDLGGITGNIFRIVRADSMHKVLDEIVDAPRRIPPLFVSNGVMSSALSADSAIVLWSKPRLYGRLSADLGTETILTRLTLTMESEEGPQHLVPNSVEYDGRSGILHGANDGMDVYWYHPLETRSRILVIAVRQPESTAKEVGLQFVMELPYWRYEELVDEHGGNRTTYHILAFNSCCDELVDRDMQDFLSLGVDTYGIDAELRAWEQRLSEARYLPEVFSDNEQQVYRRSLTTLLQAQVAEEGVAAGQIVGALQPQSKAMTQPADHLLAAEALATAGLVSASESALDFIRRAEHSRYTIYDVLGKEHGVGFPYLVSPAPYFGNGEEWRWTRPDDAVLRADGLPRYILAFEALRGELHRRGLTTVGGFDDSTFIAASWEMISSRVADVIMYRLDDQGLTMQDDSPWGEPLSDLPGVYTSILTARSLRIAADYAGVLGEYLKQFLYSTAAEKAEQALRKLAADVLSLQRPDSLTAIEQRMFHPLLTDAVSLDVFEAGSAEAVLTFDIVENGFAIEDMEFLYRSEPGGDWFSRQARPQISLRLARAYAVVGNLQRAEALFADVTRLAMTNDGLLPELVDPVSGSWYGGIPHSATAADYILTAEQIASARLKVR